MYVCLCNGVTDTQIKDAVDNGCQRMRDLRAQLGVTKQCGKCASHALEVLTQAKAQQALTVMGGKKDWPEAITWPLVLA